MTTSGTGPSQLGPGDLPVWTGSLELSESLEKLDLPSGKQPYKTVRFLVRLHHQPLGYITIPEACSSPASVAAGVWETLGESINQHLAADGMDSVTSLPVEGLEPAVEAPCEHLGADRQLPLVSVVLCTRERPTGALNVVKELVGMRYPKFEVVVVDNAPTTDATRVAIAETFADTPRVRYVVEPKPGLSRARNRGVAEARGSIVAFTDDDVQVDEWWLHGIVRGFQRSSNVGCVTGLVPSARVENPLQLYFERRVSWGWSCDSRIFDLNDHRDAAALYPYSAGIFGTGANFAFRKETLVGWGGFDEALGAGSPAGGGEDLDVFVRTLLNGSELVYEPSAIVSHHHRAELLTLNHQMFAYGSGLTAFVLKYLIDRNTIGDVLRRIPKGLQQLFDIQARSDNIPVSNSTRVREGLGMLYGPLAYLRGRYLEHRPPARRFASGDGEARPSASETNHRSDSPAEKL